VGKAKGTENDKRLNADILIKIVKNGAGIV
jgi:hypothetical protein